MMHLDDPFLEVVHMLFVMLHFVCCRIVAINLNMSLPAVVDSCCTSHFFTRSFPNHCFFVPYLTHLQITIDRYLDG